MREAVFVPQAEHLPKAVSAEEAAPAVRDTQIWLERVLRPEIFEAFRGARWLGFRQGSFQETDQDVVSADAMTKLGEVQVLGFSRRLLIRVRLVHPEPSPQSPVWLGSSLETADRVLQLDTPRAADAWDAASAAEFLIVSRTRQWQSEGWKGIELVTDGHGLALSLLKLPEGLRKSSSVPDFDALLRPDPNWFAAPPAAHDR
ncbi:MAG: hypothetical protein JW751_19860 [Polyangiaceae bacterium]|nr:hypothetical protein [Polyangiaceae bacterium]